MIANFLYRIMGFQNLSPFKTSQNLSLADRGGILKLGASEWRPDTWKWVEDEIQHRVYDENEALCYNANLRSYGSFAVLYSEQTYQYIIDWANRQLDGGEFPFDHVFKHITCECFLEFLSP
jgi:hypothetical protein